MYESSLGENTVQNIVHIDMLLDLTQCEVQLLVTTSKTSFVLLGEYKKKIVNIL